jgi:restriction system protein
MDRDELLELIDCAARDPVTLLDRDDFIRLLLEHYENLDPEYETQIPLRKIWMPTE